ncbi:MAG: response regulator [Lachnospiraceae bacterium]|nr:response regulator [Lachnospiraceae bacterium]MDE7271676.1 response regulator [Lachnospiraceae bacterium]
MKRKKEPTIQNKPQMLIVDDKAVNRYVLKSIFEDSYEIIECQDGRVAMEVLEEKRDEVTAVLLDIVMPVCDGFAVLKYMKETALHSVPVILISSNVDDKNIHKACAYDVADYIQKPFQEEVVRRRVQRVIDLYQTKRTNIEYEQAE